MLFFATTRLFRAIRDHDYSQAKYLLENGADADAIQDGIPALYYAIERNNPRIIGLLAQYGTHVYRAWKNETPLLFACIRLTREYQNGQTIRATVQELVKVGCNVNAQDQYGRTALMYLCQYGDYSSVEWLVQNALVATYLTDLDGHTALDFARSGRTRDHKECMRALAEEQPPEYIPAVHINVRNLLDQMSVNVRGLYRARAQREVEMEKHRQNSRLVILPDNVDCPICFNSGDRYITCKQCHNITCETCFTHKSYDKCWNCRGSFGK